MENYLWHYSMPVKFEKVTKFYVNVAICKVWEVQLSFMKEFVLQLGPLYFNFSGFPF